ncbi:hypothetical protein AA12717_0177 [Gluconacetobacter sacchari DSM 12717]|uniref:FkbM family methyltransferase n=2 Tax=Gluconacetobacter sacchari TaxID=92759 RepID=A0A7W4NPH7_9PROT|nr:FkbM family methyltransferase [Gluconacetobacter sacchari]MBB2161669.1 FkbM family methyltransferase [Gluconacetobacter sacchari]GBQ19221.1 hypothetical protein AA12717_0177 [Gluconacetobacter sacchari DSM 12717]
MSDSNQIETIFQALLGRAPLPHEVQAYESLQESPQVLGLRLMESREFRRRAVLGAFSAGATQWVCAEIRDGLRIWADLMDVGVSAGAIADNWEPAETAFILSILRKGGTFIDIGAHIGWFTILGAHKVGPEGRVYAFEPRPAIFERLRASVEANGFQDRCILHCAALSDTAGTVSMATFSREFNSGHAVMVSGTIPEDASLVEDIPTIVLDGLAWDRRIDLIKIDVEGAEALVLRGGRALLLRDRPIIVSEFFPMWLRKVSLVSPDEFMTFLKGLGYRVFELASHGIGREIHALERNRSFDEDYYTNIVALTDAHIDQYLLRPLDGRVQAYEAALARLEGEAHAHEAELARLRAERTAEQAAHEAEARAHEAELVRLRAECAAERVVREGEARVHEAALAQLRAGQDAERAGRETILEGLKAELAAEKAAYARQAETLAQREAELQGLQGRTENRVQQIARENSALMAQLRTLHEQKAALAAQSEALQASNIWRACMVLMRVGRRVPAPVRKLSVRSAKLGWWSATGQLPQRWRAWQQIRRRGGLTVVAPQPALPAPVADPAGELARWAGRRGPVALIVDDRWPEPDRDSGSLDAVNLIRNLISMGFEVVFGVASDLIQDERYRDGLAALGVRLVPQNGSAQVQRYIEENRDVFTLVILVRFNCGGALFELVRYNCPDARIIFNTVDLYFLREQRAALLSGDRDALEQAGRTRDREEWLVGHADLTIVVSETEKEILSTAVPRAPVLLQPLVRDIVPPAAPFSARRGVGFVGGFAHQPNLDAIRWFLAEIWPLVRRQCPDLTFSIVGSHLPDGIARPEDGVTYLGPIDDLHAWFETLRASVAPLRFGAGAKGKVASSLASGLPCVLSTVAAEGMNLVDGENVLIADTPEMFADRVVALASDEGLWQRMSAAALDMARQQFSHQANRRGLHEALIKMGVPVPDVFPGSDVIQPG